MKHCIAFLVALVALCSAAGNKIDLRTGTLSPISGPPEIPERTIEYTDDGIIVKYTFRYGIIYDDGLFSGTVSWEIPGFTISTVPGEPALPSRAESFLTPRDSEPIIKLVSAKYHDFPYEISPARFPIPDSDTIKHTTANVIPLQPYQGMFPVSVCEQLSTGKYRNQPVARVKINPVQYNYTTRTVHACTELVYKITYTGTERAENIDYEPCSLLNPNCTVNANGCIMPLSDESCIDAYADYLIISVPEFEDALQPFIEWKKRTGHNVTALYNSEWTPETIKDAVIQQFITNNSLMYLLIAGDNSLVPAEVKTYNRNSVSGTTTNYNYITDFHYGCIDGVDDFIPDFYRGRWPVNTVDDLTTVVEKTLAYEQAPVTDTAFYTKATHFGYFEDEGEYGYTSNGSFTYIFGSNGTEDRRFVKTCEDVRDYMQTHTNIDIERLYFAYPKMNALPQRWSSKFSLGESIPEDLTPEHYLWGRNEADLSSSINNGVLYTLYRGHGNASGWTIDSGYKTRFGINQIQTLVNGSLLPLVFSITCNTGNHTSSDCFARSMLAHKNGGAIALFAQTNSGYSGVNDRLVSLLFNAIWPSPQGLSLDRYPVYDYLSTPTVAAAMPVYQLGGIMDFALNGLDIKTDIGHPAESWSEELYTRRITHCFGDPGLMFNTDTPTAFEHVDVTRRDNEVTVTLGDGPAYISFYDRVNDYSCRYYGTSATYYTGASGCIDVTVQGHNKIPYTEQGAEYDPEFPELGGPKSKLIGYRDLRAGGRIEVDCIISSAEKNANISLIIVPLFGGSSAVSQAQVDMSILDRKQTINMYCPSGYMVASLMVNGYPQSNMKMIIAH